MVESLHSDLSPREVQCLAWAATGKNASEIATILGIPGVAVGQALTSACQKLDATRLPEAIILAVQDCLI
ncbi:helix-turn-helix domain-containing protein [Mesorhizobium sp. CN2-181]|uniref:helix-turn-helix domain-containing protein n=1 Tax=Mesorhizobium yinganensis TaxID=3157707 RepID=UPI0032B83760